MRKIDKNSLGVASTEIYYIVQKKHKDFYMNIASCKL